jgi:hypothetical protein
MKEKRSNKPGSGEAYRQFMAEEYQRLELRRLIGTASIGLEEVKLRLFLSLLEKPSFPREQGRAVGQ